MTRPSSFLLRSLFGRPAAAASPDKTQPDVRYVIAVGPIILSSFEGIKKPFIPISEIDKGLIRHKELQPGIWSKCSSDVSVIPNHSTGDPEVGYEDVRNPKIVDYERSSCREPGVWPIIHKIIIHSLT